MVLNMNHRNWRFNHNIGLLFPGRFIKVLDLGCAGGGMVHDFLDGGHVAVGLEGSDYCLKNQKFENPYF